MSVISADRHGATAHSMFGSYEKPVQRTSSADSETGCPDCGCTRFAIYVSEVIVSVQVDVEVGEDIYASVESKEIEDSGTASLGTCRECGCEIELAPDVEEAARSLSSMVSGDDLDFPLTSNPERR